MFCRLRGFSVTATEIKGKCCKQKEATADLVILGKIFYNVIWETKIVVPG